MKLNNYCLVLFMGMLWSTGATPGTANINLAEVGELPENIHGIGPNLAQAIGNYREEYGDLVSIEELTGVRRIGLTTIQANRDLIVVKDAPLQTQI